MDEMYIKNCFDKFYSFTDNQYAYLKEAIIPKILAKGDKASVMEKKLLIRFAVQEKCLYRGYNPIQVQFQFLEGTKGGYYSNEKNIIIFNEVYLRGTPSSLRNQYPFFVGTTSLVDRMLLIAFHESEHYIQRVDLMNGIITKNSFAYLLYLVFNRNIHPENNITEYTFNYSFKEIESYANEQGWYDVVWFYARMNYSREQHKGPFIAWLECVARSHMSFQKEYDENGKIHNKIIENYNIGMLSNIVKLLPKLLDEYPVLKEFYQVNGKEGILKDPKVLVSNYMKLDSEYRQRWGEGVKKGYDLKRVDVNETKYVYRQFFYHLLDKGYDFGCLNGDVVLNDLILNDLFSLQALFDVRKKDQNIYQHIVEIKVNRLVRAINLLMQHNKYDSYIEDIIRAASEVLRVYETSKLMYSDANEEVENFVGILRQLFGLTEIEYRDPKGRSSAVNI